jgi:hypothetical protein
MSGISFGSVSDQKESLVDPNDQDEERPEYDDIESILQKFNSINQNKLDDKIVKSFLNQPDLKKYQQYSIMYNTN